MESNKRKDYIAPTAECFEIAPAMVIASSTGVGGVTEKWKQNDDTSGSDSWTNSTGEEP